MESSLSLWDRGEHTGSVCVADTSNNRIQTFTSGGTYVTKWGSSGTGNGQFNHPMALR